MVLLQDDTTAYNGVIAAYRLPKETEEEKAARHAAVQEGLIHAADVPLDICRAALRVCRLAATAAEIGNPGAVTDAGCAALFGEAAAQGARAERSDQPGFDRGRGLHPRRRGRGRRDPRRDGRSAHGGAEDHAREAVRATPGRQRHGPLET